MVAAVDRFTLHRFTLKICPWVWMMELRIWVQLRVWMMESRVWVKLNGIEGLAIIEGLGKIEGLDDGIEGLDIGN